MNLFHPLRGFIISAYDVACLQIELILTLIFFPHAAVFRIPHWHQVQVSNLLLSGQLYLTSQASNGLAGEFWTVNLTIAMLPVNYVEFFVIFNELLKATHTYSISSDQVWGHLSIDHMADVYLSGCLERSFNVLWMKAARRKSRAPETIKHLIASSSPTMRLQQRVGCSQMNGFSV